MSENKVTSVEARMPTRRQLVTGAVVALGSLAAGSAVFGKTPSAMTELPSTGPNKMRCSLHQEVEFNASSQRIYDVLLSSREFAAFSDAPAQIGREAGSEFSMFDGKIVGRNIELVSDQRIVQAWRPIDWNPGVYSIVKFELTSRGSQTNVALDHAGFPEGTFDHLNVGWKLKYWDPLRKYLA
ncbi:MAG TPA: SRPBCC domain-containing protein [Candidatus Eremiobacteraceae bacterium]